MTKPKITLWLLNRVVHWNRDALVANLMERFDVKLGRRVVEKSESHEFVELPVNALERGAPGELMHEGANYPCAVTAFDEYFVPIPTKCVGAPRTSFWQGIASQAGGTRLDQLEKHWLQRLPAGVNPAVAKGVIGPQFGEVRMNTAEPQLGYYEMLQRATQETGAQNVLVGYSQGGTVARYLAFLDEHVAKPGKRCIQAVITVQSPNRGSPVASKSKDMELSRAILAILLSLSKWVPAQFRDTPLWRFLGRACANSAMVSFVNELLDAELNTWSMVPEAKRLRETWRTTRKWLSGLSGLPDLAFWDLDPVRLTEEGSVLNAIDAYPLNAVQHGAVIGTDNRLHDFINALLHDAPWTVRFAAWWKSKLIDELVAQADGIYKTDAMCFPAGTPLGLIAEYQTGLRAGTYGLQTEIGAAAHDFVIPSVSQLLVPQTPAHLGNFVNRNASHLTGAVEWPQEDGETDEELVLTLLRRIDPGGARGRAEREPAEPLAA